MEIQDIHIYRGRNIYSHHPVMKMVIDIGEYGETPTKDIPGFHDLLLKSFPELKRNSCGLGYEGGFLERLYEGTYLGHVTEHVILDLQNSLGYDVKYGKTRMMNEGSLYYIIYQFENEVCGLECGKAAVFILNCFLNKEDIDIDEFLRYLKKISLDGELGPSTSAIVEEAKKRNIPVTRIGHESLIRLGYGKNSRLIEATLTDATSCISADISSNKQLTKAILYDNQIPVPYGKVVYSEISALMAANQIGAPVVIKPFDGNQGKGVHLNLYNKKQIHAAFAEASKYSKGVVVEEFITGRDYRVLVVGDRVCAVAERLPAMVHGDGVHSVRELVDIVNAAPERGEDHEKALTKIKLDDDARKVLKKNGFDPEYIPEQDEIIVLRENGNISTGGTAIDCTDRIHPENCDIAVRAAKAIGLDVAGIDIVTNDIGESILENDGAIVEVNTAPGIRMHLYPSVGTAHNVAKDIVDLLFPTEESAQFPIVSVTGTNGKTTTVRVISHVLSLTGKNIGFTSTSGTFINETCICKGDNSGPLSARALLTNKKIEGAVLETARGGIVREGLGYDLADIGVVTNIAEDHLGTDSIDTLEDLAFVKSLVVEAVKDDGYAVLNAEDTMTPYFLERIKAKPILFGTLSFPVDDTIIHVYADEGQIKIKDGNYIHSIVEIKNIPITCNGSIVCNIQNCLTAVSALYGLKVPTQIIKEGLETFVDNQGRFQLYELNGKTIMLDYAHNKAGFEQALNAISSFDYRQLIGVLGMPGDRPDEAIQSSGELFSRCFDRIYLKEDVDLRGRKHGEVAGILYDTVTKNGYDKEKIEIVYQEIDALKKAMELSNENDFIVIFYEKLEPLVEYIEEQKRKK